MLKHAYYSYENDIIDEPAERSPLRYSLSEKQTVNKSHALFKIHPLAQIG